MYGTTISGNSHFVRHGPCDSCGSKDNVGWYSNGSGFCFGCGKVYRSGIHSHVVGSGGSKTETKLDRAGGAIRPPPDDCDTYFPHAATDWLRKFDLGPEDVIKHNVRWSKKREQLVYLFYGESDEVVLWQARNFREGTTHKSRFFTGGTPEAVIAAYHGKQDTDTCVLVEDCISAIKVAMSGGGSGVPCFSASVSPKKLTQLSRMYKRILVWLDADKFSEAVKISNRAKLLGCESRVIHTSQDPKYYNLFELGTLIS